MGKKRIGFIDEEYYEEEEMSTEYGQGDSDIGAEPLDLNSTLIKAINIIGTYMLGSKGMVKGISVSVDENGKYTSNITY